MKEGSGFEGQRERATKDRWIVEFWVWKKPENKGGNVLFDDNAQKEGEKITSCYTLRVLRICALGGGYEKFERKKGIKEDEVERWCIASTDAH